MSIHIFIFFFFFNDTATTEIYTLSLHDALPISRSEQTRQPWTERTEDARCRRRPAAGLPGPTRTPPGGRRPLHQRPLGPGAGAPYPPYLYRPTMQVVQPRLYGASCPGFGRT